MALRGFLNELLALRAKLAEAESDKPSVPSDDDDAATSKLPSKPVGGRRKKPLVQGGADRGAATNTRSRPPQEAPRLSYVITSNKEDWGTVSQKAEPSEQGDRPIATSSRQSRAKASARPVSLEVGLGKQKDRPLARRGGKNRARVSLHPTSQEPKPSGEKRPIAASSRQSRKASPSKASQKSD